MDVWKKLIELKTVSGHKLINDVGSRFFDWNGKLYQSDIVSACIRPKAKAVDKLIAKHISEDEQEFKTNPNRGIRFLLEGPLGDIYLRFYFRNGQQLVAPYVDIIHLGKNLMRMICLKIP